MNIKELTHNELSWNLQRLHIYLNRKYFSGKLDPIMVKVELLPDGVDAIFARGENTDSIIINLHALAIYECMTRSIPDQVEKLQLQWLVTIMLHSMIDQYVSEYCDDDPGEVAEKVGLMQYGSRTEWINPLRFAFIQKEFALHHTEEEQIILITVKG